MLYSRLTQSSATSLGRLFHGKASVHKLGAASSVHSLGYGKVHTTCTVVLLGIVVIMHVIKTVIVIMYVIKTM